MKRTGRGEKARDEADGGDGGAGGEDEGGGGQEPFIHRSGPVHFS